MIVEWRAFELRPGGKFPGTPEEEARYRDKVRRADAPVMAYARDYFGVEINMDAPWGVNSRPAHEGSWYAREQGKLEEYNRACFTAHWQQSKKIDDIDTLTEIARSVGLDGDGFRAAVDGGKYRVEVEMDLMLAREIGIDGVPAFVFGNRYLVSGARPARVLEQVVDRCVEEGLIEK